LVKLVDDLQSIDDSRGFPLWLIVTGPFDEVLQFVVATECSRVQDSVSVLFGFPINLHWRWGFLVLAWIGVAGSRVQQGDVEDGVDAHALGKFQTIGIW
jgi:hypothetical protein